jgi:hypothetical protein
LKGGFCLNYANLFSGKTNQTNFRNSDAIVDSLLGADKYSSLRFARRIGRTKSNPNVGYFLTNQPKPVRWERLTPLDGTDTTGILSRGEIGG